MWEVLNSKIKKSQEDFDETQKANENIIAIILIEFIDKILVKFKSENVLF